MWSRQCVWIFYQCVLNNVLLLLQISVSLYFNSLDKNPKLWEKTFQTSRRCPKAHISLTCLCLSIAGIKGVWYHCQERQPLPPTFSKLNRQMKQGCDEDHAHCLFSFFEDNFNPFQVWYSSPPPPVSTKNMSQDSRWMPRTLESIILTSDLHKLTVTLWPQRYPHQTNKENEINNTNVHLSNFSKWFMFCFCFS